MKKVFLITMFGSPFPWIQDYIDNVQNLEQYGWYWKIFTPHPIQSKGNVEIVSLEAEDYSRLVEGKLGVKANLYITPDGIPSLHITDFYIFSGIVFEDYIKGFDFWGITNMDVVYGRLDHFYPDELLKQVDVLSDDVNTFNGVFSLLKNTEKVNNLFRKMPNWKEVIGQEPCPGCLKLGEHFLFGSDEYQMTEVLKNSPEIETLFPQYYPMLSHDRLENHTPTPKLEIKPDGSLWELLKDVNGPKWLHSRPFVGREIPYFHFQRTKKWPL